MEKVLIFGIDDLTAELLSKCWVEFEEKYHVVGFSGIGSNIENGSVIRFKNIEAKFFNNKYLKDLDFDICFLCSLNRAIIPSDIKRWLPAGTIIIDALTYYNEILKNRFMDYCNDHEEFKQDNLEVYQYVKRKNVQMYPYDWFDNAIQPPIEVKKDVSCNMKYAIYNQKQIYYPEDYSDEMIKEGITFFIKEQMIYSPHCYMPDMNHEVKIGDIVLDCGAAEANFSLDVIDRVKKIYLYEGDTKWIPALRKTFEQYKDKVVIIDKFLDSYVHEGFETIDNTVVEKEINFIKMDLEGYELKALYGAKKHIINSQDLRLSICTYHQHEDAAVLSCYLQSLGCKWHYGKGKLFRTDSSIWQSKVPDLRIGMIYANRMEN